MSRRVLVRRGERRGAERRAGGGAGVAGWSLAAEERPRSTANAAEIGLAWVRMVGAALLLTAGVADWAVQHSMVGVLLTAVLAGLLLAATWLAAPARAGAVAESDGSGRALGSGVRAAVVGLDAAVGLAVVLAGIAPPDLGWVVLVVPVLEAALQWRMRGAVLVWGLLSAAWLGSALALAELVADPTTVLAEQLARVLARSAAVLLAALPAGWLAEQLLLEVRAQRRATGEAQHRSRLLQRVAQAGQRVTRLDSEVLADVVGAATGLGFRSVDVVEREGDAWHVLAASEADALPLAALRGLSAAADMATRRRATVVVDAQGATTEERAALEVAGLGAVVLAALERNDQGPPLLLRASVGREGTLTPPQVEGLDLLAGHAGTALRNDVLVSELRRMQEQLTHQAYSDALTGLANRPRFLQRLEEALARPRRSGEALAVLYLDLDRFKAVNDTLGHDAGNELLIAVAGRIRAALRQGDVVARLGGDEFAVLMDPITSAAEAEGAGDRIVAALSMPFALGANEALIGTSVGIAVDDGTTAPAELVRRADLAMYAAKEAGKGCWQHWEPRLDDAARERTAIEIDLRHALARGELAMAWQPVRDLAEGTVAGYEGLLRWHHPRFGTLLPERFLPLAEDSGTLVEIGRWVLRRAGEQAARLRREGHPAFVAVNISPRELADPGFLAELDALLASGARAEDLLLELPERVLAVEGGERVLQAIHDRGVRLALDDVGAGQTSLTGMRRLPLDMLKIDGTVLADAADLRDRTVLRSLVGLGRALGLTVVGEGVETAEQAALLQALGCELAQGFHLGAPAAQADAGHLLAAGG